jgi:hypothetical protein
MASLLVAGPEGPPPPPGSPNQRAGVFGLREARDGTMGPARSILFDPYIIVVIIDFYPTAHACRNIHVTT